MNKEVENVLDKFADLACKNNKIDPYYYTKYNVKRGLRNSDSTGVLVGLTEIGDVHGYILDENEKIPVEGRLTYRGINVKDIVTGFQKENRFGFEEVCYLLLFGELPTRQELTDFCQMIGNSRILPEGFKEDMILKAPSNNIMNKLARCVLASYSYDDNPEERSIKNIVRQSIELVARFPIMVAYAYQAKVHYFDGKSLFIHRPQEKLSTAQNFLHMTRADNKYTSTEAELLDLALVLHGEHGGGNNSAFATHVVSSTDTDTYSAIASAVGALKGTKHGGANHKVINMIKNIKENIDNWENKDEVKNYLVKILRKEAFDKTGLIYGMGHAVYTLSDPRAVLLKEKAYKLAKEKDREKEFNLYLLVEKLAPEVFCEEKNVDKKLCANVDFYSGFVYNMLNIPQDLYTPIFAVARIAGWCAHRMEEIISGQRIIRPAYKNVMKRRKYIAINEREQ